MSVGAKKNQRIQIKPVLGRSQLFNNLEACWDLTIWDGVQSETEWSTERMRLDRDYRITPVQSVLILMTNNRAV